MEKLQLNLNGLSSIIIALIEKIQLLNSDITKQQKIVANKEMIEIAESCRNFFSKASSSAELDDYIKSFNEKMERAFSQFDWNMNVAVSPCEFHKFSENGKSLISSILKILGPKGCGVLIIETYIKLCLKVIADMTVDAQQYSVDKTNFKMLINSFLSSINMFKKYWHIAFLPDQKYTIMFCLHQICRILPFLLKMIQHQNADLKKHALNNIRKCFIRITEEIHSSGNLQPKNCGQEFITIMNFCLYKLNEITNYHKDFLSFMTKANESASSLKPMIDELLCYVMSVAQVTNFESDYSAIVTGSQKVLKEFCNFLNKINEENGPEIKLSASSLGELLCSLEHLVNTAVLKLVLEVFSGINCPLKNIVNKCRTDIERNNKSSADLNVLISDFDSEMDKITQIGFFAISCSSNIVKILRIRSCLASLESLETELIPSLTAVYIDCSAKNKINFLHLMDFWLNEMSELKILLDSILDPAGFCKVVQNQVKSLTETLKTNTSSELNLDEAKPILKKIIRYSRKLIKTLKTSGEDEDFSLTDTTEKYLINFQKALQECEAIFEKLEEACDVKISINRVLKRCNLLLDTLNNLTSHLFDLYLTEESSIEVTETIAEDTKCPNFSTINIPQKDYYQFCDLGKISTTSLNEMEILTPYLEKGKLLAKKRNILYTTPSQSEKEWEDSFDRVLQQAKHWDKTPVSKKRSRCCKPLNQNLELENSIDLEMTAILGSVSELSRTFINTINQSSQTQMKDYKGKTLNKGIDVGCCTEKNLDDLKLNYTSSGCCANLDSAGNEQSNPMVTEETQEQNNFGEKFRNQLLQSLNDLSLNSSLEIMKENDSDIELETPDRLNDLKIVQQKINFLKEQAPEILP